MPYLKKRLHEILGAYKLCQLYTIQSRWKVDGVGGRGWYTQGITIIILIIFEFVLSINCVDQNIYFYSVLLFRGIQIYEFIIMHFALLKNFLSLN